MLRSTMAKKDTGQYLLRPPRQLVNRLSEVAKQFERVSGNQVAIEILTEYLDFWIETETARREALAAQKERFSKIKQEMLRQPLRKATTEPVTKPAAKRKTK